jgi:hypothetical protein
VGAREEQIQIRLDGRFLAEGAAAMLEHYETMQRRCGVNSVIAYGWEVPQGGWATLPERVPLITRVRGVTHKELFSRDEIAAFRDSPVVGSVKRRLRELAVSVAEVSRAG